MYAEVSVSEAQLDVVVKSSIALVKSLAEELRKLEREESASDTVS